MAWLKARGIGDGLAEPRQDSQDWIGDGLAEMRRAGDREKQPLAGDSRPTLWVLGGKGGTRQIRTIPMCIY